MGKYYAVLKGKNPGIYTSWDDCKKQVIGFKDARYKGFENEEDAKTFMENSSNEYLNDMTEENIETYAFVDGSFNQKTNTYGYGGFIIHKKDVEGEDGIVTKETVKTLLQGSSNDSEMALMRNVAGEITGSMEAIKEAIKLGYKSLVLFYDYAGIEMWATGQWNRTKQGTQDYYDFIQKAKEKINISFVKVKGHTGIEGNEEVDKLAKEACGIE